LERYLHIPKENILTAHGYNNGITKFKLRCPTAVTCHRKVAYIVYSFHLLLITFIRTIAFTAAVATFIH